MLWVPFFPKLLGDRFSINTQTGAVRREVSTRANYKGCLVPPKLVKVSRWAKVAMWFITLHGVKHRLSCKKALEEYGIGFGESMAAWTRARAAEALAVNARIREERQLKGERKASDQPIVRCPWEHGLFDNEYAPHGADPVLGF